MNTDRDENQHQAKDTVMFISWIAIILIMASLSFVFSQPLRDSLLINAVNKVLSQSGDPRRLMIDPFTPESRDQFAIGKWYAMNQAADGQFSQGTKAFVFSFFGEGTFFPCAAIVNSDRKVLEFIPLSSHGQRMIRKVSPGILQIYTRRIEGNE